VGFNPQGASISELSKLADTAIRRSELADQAAALSKRWLLLSEVSAAIAAFAEQLLEEREEGAISLSAWDDYKTASNTYLAECEAALKNVSNSTFDMDTAVTALMSLKDS
jgi:predicted ATPase